jgi:hypothetical protein
MSAEERQNVMLIGGVLTGPLALLTDLLASFVLVPWVCANRWQPALHVVNFVFLAIALGSAWVAWQNRGDGGTERYGPFLAEIGLAVSALSALQILGIIVVTFIMGACQ